MSEVQQRVNKTAFESALKSKGVTQSLLAEKVGANPKSFSRWINDGYIQSKYILDVAEELDLSERELGEILMVPTFEVFFRRKFLGEVPENIRARAIDLAKTLFDLTYLDAKTHFCPPNTSKVADANEVANQIRKYTGLENFKSLDAIITNLASQGVEVAVIPFEKMGLYSDQKLESAFSVTDGKRCLIFLDASEPEELLIFNLCHELCHLFRPDAEITKAEESFCNAVASELVYPKKFFTENAEVISKIIESKSIEAMVNLLSAIQDKLGGEPFGIALRLKSLGLLSQKDPLHKKLVGYGAKSFEDLKKRSADKSLFQTFNPKDKAGFVNFWSQESLKEDSLLRFFLHVRNAATEESISPRRFCELFDSDLGVADELIRRWRQALSTSLSQLPNE